MPGMSVSSSRTDRMYSSFSRNARVGNPVSVCRKSGSPVSFLLEIRCQFIILARKSGVSSSFLPEKTNRHRITRKDELTPD